MISGLRPPSGPVVVYDCEGYLVGAGIAELLALDGRDVHLVTPYPVLSPILDHTLEGEQLRRHLLDVGVRGHRGVTLSALNGARGSGTGIEDEPWHLDASGVVLVTQQKSNDDLYLALVGNPAALERADIQAVYRIGDAASPRMTSEAVFDAHRLARELDGTDPATPLAFLREPTTKQTAGSTPAT